MRLGKEQGGDREVGERVGVARSTTTPTHHITSLPNPTVQVTTRGGATTPQHPTLHPAAQKQPKTDPQGFWPPAPLLPPICEHRAPPPPYPPCPTTSPHRPPPLFRTARPKLSHRTWFHWILPQPPSCLAFLNAESHHHCHLIHLVPPPPPITLHCCFTWRA